MSQAPAPIDPQDLSDLRQKLEDAVRGERYEEAAELRDQLRRAELGEAAEGEESN
jgi:protein-arginine kinase activator protein McsA